MESLTASDSEYAEREKKYRAKGAVDTILAAEQHKNDKELKPHIDAEMKERHGHLKAAMKDDKKKPAKKEAPAKKDAPKKKEEAKKPFPAKKPAKKK